MKIERKVSLTQTADSPAPTRLQEEQHKRDVPPEQEQRQQKSAFLWQFLRFCMVGGLNTAVDLLILNSLLLLWPTQNTLLLLTYNSIAYAVGAVNSFAWNKYWTFQDRQKASVGEVIRFAVTTLLGIVCNDALLWMVGSILHSAMLSASLSTNIAKILAIGGTVLISYLGMRLWVFVRQPQKDEKNGYATRK